MSIPAPSPHAFWDLIAGVHVINLDQRTDRWEKIQRDVIGIVPASKLTRSPAVLGRTLPGYGQRPWFRGRSRDTTWGARAGCILAHRHALELAVKSNCPILVLEDDITFTPEASEVLPKLGEWLRDHADSWDICYLGYTDPSGPWRQLIELPSGFSLHEVLGCNCAHAYVVNKRLRDHILQKLPQPNGIWTWLSRHRAVDRWYLRTLGRRFKIVAVSPCLVEQDAGFSDIVGRKTNYRESGHRVVIPCRSPHPITFRLLRGLHVLGTHVSGFYDRLRGHVKHVRGF